ncbi:MAG: SMI1/KNR4 family protein [Limnothrix sp. RL_2_0]|nr:SMI1/KNR4 family protein [Limnothrix sp. RL_2_0]
MSVVTNSPLDFLKNNLEENRPCSSSEIKELEKQLNICLPKIYVDFLLILGRGTQDFWKGEDCFFKHLPTLQIWARELLDEDKSLVKLPSDAFVFFMHQGYQFSFFKTSEGQDPPIYHYSEGQNKKHFIQIHNRFSDFLEAEINLFREYRCDS